MTAASSVIPPGTPATGVQRQRGRFLIDVDYERRGLRWLGFLAVTRAYHIRCSAVPNRFAGSVASMSATFLPRNHSGSLPFPDDVHRDGSDLVASWLPIFVNAQSPRVDPVGGLFS